MNLDPPTCNSVNTVSAFSANGDAARVTQISGLASSKAIGVITSEFQPLHRYSTTSKMRHSSIVPANRPDRSASHEDKRR
jgi:hypothetical protein